VLRLKAKVSDLLVPGNTSAWFEVRNRLNRLLRGWSAYFGYGTRLPASRAIDNHVYDRVRHFLVRRHGTDRFPREAVFGALGVLHLRRVHLGPRRMPCDEASRKAGCGKSARPVGRAGRGDGFGSC
jgi:RNA-directed DNA polymerase